VKTISNEIMQQLKVEQTRLSDKAGSLRMLLIVDADSTELGRPFASFKEGELRMELSEVLIDPIISILNAHSKYLDSHSANGFVFHH
jgi:hypothetical protein